MGVATAPGDQDRHVCHVVIMAPVEGRAGVTRWRTVVPMTGAVMDSTSGVDLDPVGLKEIAARCGVPADTVKKWRNRHANFPAPRWTVSGSAAWAWQDVAAWLSITRRGHLLRPRMIPSARRGVLPGR